MSSKPARSNARGTDAEVRERPDRSSQEVQKKGQAARLRSLERALRQERTAHIAIATAVLDTVDNPQEVVDRIEGMARAVVRDRRVPRGTKDAVLAARDLFARTVEQRTGRPQQLFEPDVGHINPADAAAVAGMREDQLSLDDARDVHNDKTQHWRELQDSVLNEIRTRGPLADPQLIDAVPRGHLPSRRVYDARVDLTRAGRIVRCAEQSYFRDGHSYPVYDLMERRNQ